MTATNNSNTFSPCCLKNFAWGGTPSGHESTLANNPTYVTGNNPHKAVLFVHDALGWRFSNARLLADHYAQEADVTVYLPDFFGGETLDQKAILEGRLADLDIASFSARNSRANREPEVFACATALRAQGFTKIGAAGFCYGGWAVLRLASAEHNPPLVDCVVAAHPSWVTEADIVGVEKPLLVLAPEADPVYPEELKMLTFRTMVIEKKNVPFEYVHLPGVQHGCLTKGREEVAGEREAMVKGKERAVGWFKQFLSD